jgi:pilus assembly protein Flp/PilA
MLDLIVLAKALYKNRRGVTAMEYGLIAGAIAMAIVTVVGTMGNKIANIFNNVSNGL